MVYVSWFPKCWSWCIVGAWVFQLTTSVFPEAPTTPLIDPSAPISIPFEDGERIRYEVNWRPLPFLPSVRAGQVDFCIRKQEYLGTPAYRITAQARSDTSLAAMGLEIEDEFEVDLTIANIGEKAIHYNAQVVKDGTLVASGRLAVACVLKRLGEPMTATAIPSDIVKRFQVAGS